MKQHHDATIHNMTCVSSADLGDCDACWIGWYTPQGTQDTRLVGIDTTSDRPHILTDEQSRHVQAVAGYDWQRYASVWAELIA